MRHQKRVAKLGRTPSHRKALLTNLCSAIIEHGKLKTTDAKAKAMRSQIERLITYAKKGTLHHRRLAFRILQDRTLVQTLFSHIAPQFASRPGGYTRITKLGFRDNDTAPMSLIELVDYKLPEEAKKPVKKGSEKTSKSKTPKEKTAPAVAEKPELESLE